MSSRLLAALSLATVAYLLTPMAHRVRRSWRERIAVAGESMRPTLEPGDWLLVDPLAYEQSPPRPGDLVVVPDPREPQRMLVKRVRSVERGTRLRVTGDAPDRSTDSRSFGPVEAATVAGRPWFRYWPPRRAGSID